jgi:hypothetical protein
MIFNRNTFRACAILFLVLFLSSCQRIAPDKGPANQRLGDRQPDISKNENFLTDEARFRKLSLHLRGITPELSEYSALSEARKAGKLDDFFASKTKQYLASPAHAGKMIDRLDELFRVRTASGLPETRLEIESGNPSLLPGGETYNSMDLLFQEIATKNLSWDTLLSGKSYKVPSFQQPLNPNQTSDLAFFADVAENLPQPPDPFVPPPMQNTIYPAQFDSTDPRIAGAVTTARFFNRYSTTDLNKNRGRAAAIFRIFLCDEMHQVVPNDPASDSDLINQAFPNNGTKPTSHFEQIHPSIKIIQDPHGTDPSCMACHYKLDPLGRSFLTSTMVLSEVPSPGALVFKRYNESTVSIAGQGLGDLATAILAQPDYKRCQVTQFWKWFIDGGTPPTESRLEELVAQFDSVQHRTNDFIAYLVNQPDFFYAPSSPTTGITLTDVKSSLQRCDGCHSGLTNTHIPSFVQLPIGGLITQYQKWLEDIVDELDLAHDGNSRSMPPGTSAWQPSADDLASLKQWISAGAPDESGSQTISPTITRPWFNP